MIGCVMFCRSSSILVVSAFIRSCLFKAEPAPQEPEPSNPAKDILLKETMKEAEQYAKSGVSASVIREQATPQAKAATQVQETVALESCPAPTPAEAEPKLHRTAHHVQEEPASPSAQPKTTEGAAAETTARTPKSAPERPPCWETITNGSKEDQPAGKLEAKAKSKADKSKTKAADVKEHPKERGSKPSQGDRTSSANGKQDASRAENTGPTNNCQGEDLSKPSASKKRGLKPALEAKHEEEKEEEHEPERKSKAKGGKGQQKQAPATDPVQDKEEEQPRKKGKGKGGRGKGRGRNAVEERPKETSEEPKPKQGRKQKPEKAMPEETTEETGEAEEKPNRAKKAKRGRTEEPPEESGKKPKELPKAKAKKPAGTASSSVNGSEKEERKPSQKPKPNTPAEGNPPKRKQELSAEEESKSRKSRKSCAYHRAFLESMAECSDEEVARVAARKAGLNILSPLSF